MVVGHLRGEPQRRRGRRLQARVREALVGDAAPQVLEPLLQLGAAVGSGERLEPPEAVSVPMQHVVVVGEVEVGQRHRASLGERHLLDMRCQAVAEPAEPAATHRAGRLPGVRGDLWQVVQQRERIGSCGPRRATARRR